MFMKVIERFNLTWRYEFLNYQLLFTLWDSFVKL